VWVEKFSRLALRNRKEEDLGPHQVIVRLSGVYPDLHSLQAGKAAGAKGEMDNMSVTCFATVCVANKDKKCQLFERLAGGGNGPCKEFEFPFPGKPEPSPYPTTFAFPCPPYADIWDGAHSFSRSICTGNFQFGGTVTGKFRAVWIYGRPETIVPQYGYQAVEEVCISGYASSWKEARSAVIPPGGCWIRGGGVVPVDRVLPDSEAPQFSGLVDSWRRW